MLHQRDYRIERIVDYGEYRLDVLAYLVEQLPNRGKDFFFIQVGAHDGAFGDPIRTLVDKYHWKGVLLEPQPKVFERLARTYEDETQLVLLNAALGEKNGRQTLFCTERSSQLASFNRAQLAKTTNANEIYELTVDTVCFASLVAKYGIGYVDLLVIDTEGFNYEVIKMALATKHMPRPALIYFEHLHLSAADRTTCINLLGARGYRLLRNGHDTAAIYMGTDDPTVLPSPW